MTVNSGFAFELIIEVEGEFFDDPLGGPTKFGVTIPTAKKLGFDKDKDGDVDRDDIVLLDIEDARLAFKTLYWDKVGADTMPEGIDILAADLAYNSGIERVRELYDFDFYRFLTNRWRFYLKLANESAKYRANFRGWMNRLERITVACQAKFVNLMGV